MKQKCFFLLTTVLWCLASTAQNPIQLGGMWEYAVGDSANKSDYVMLPGQVKTGEKVWYKHGVYVPQDWYRQRIMLYLERLYAEATVFVNGQRVGSDSLPCAPHEYDVSELIVPGRRNMVTVCVAPTERNGIFGRMELRAGPKDLQISQIRFEPHPYDGILHMDLNVKGGGLRFDDYVAEVMMQRADIDSADIIRRYFAITKRHSVFDVSLGKEVTLWDEFYPHLYQLALVIGDAYYETTIGMRELRTDSSQVMINHHPLYLRSVMMDDPLLDSGSDVSDEQAWFDLLRKYKQWGFNHISFKGYCPTEAAFAMADKVGLFLQPGGVVGEVQTKRMMDAYGHHPSLLMTSPEGIEQIPAGEAFTIDYYKNRIERNLMSADYKGFQLLDFDLPQKESLVKEWTEFCAPIVPLTKLSGYEYTMADTLKASLEACSAYYGEVRAARITYYICNDSMQVVKGGQLSVVRLPIGKQIKLVDLHIPLGELPAPGKYSLYVAISGKYHNHWDFLVLPKKEE